MANNPDTPADQPEIALGFIVHRSSSLKDRRMTTLETRNWLSLSLLLLVFLVCFAAAGGVVQWGDSGAFIYNASGGILFPAELDAGSHPLFRAISTLVVGGFDAQGLALLNAFLLPLIAAFIVRLVVVLGGSLNAGVFAACTACLAHCVFWISTRVEVYSLNALLILACYWVVFDLQLRVSHRVRMLLLGCFTGLALSVHQLTLLCVAPLYVYALWVYRGPALLAGVGILVGLAPCAPGFVAELHRGRTAFEVVRIYLTNATPASDHPLGYEGHLFRFDRIWATKSYVVIALLSLCGPQVVGLLYPRDWRERAIWAAAAGNLVFALSYDVSDRFTFLLPGVMLLSALAWLRIERRFADAAWRAVLSAGVVAATPIALTLALLAADRGMVHLPKNEHALPYRNDVKFFLAPWLKEDSALEFVRAYAQAVPEGAVVFADWTPAGALRSAWASGEFSRRDVRDCSEYPEWTRLLPEQAAYVVRLEAGCETVGIRATEARGGGLFIPPRTATATSLH
jgi:hypothetical protein